RRRSSPPRARPCQTRDRSCSLPSCFCTPCAYQSKRRGLRVERNGLNRQYKPNATGPEPTSVREFRPENGGVSSSRSFRRKGFRRNESPACCGVGGLVGQGRMKCHL